MSFEIFDCMARVVKGITINAAEKAKAIELDPSNAERYH